VTSALALLFAVGLGRLVVAAAGIDRIEAPRAARVAWSIGASVAVGFGTVSLLHFAVQVALGRADGGLVEGVECLAVVGLAAWLRRRSVERTTELSSAAGSASSGGRLAWVLCGAVVLAAATLFALATAKHPFGYGDALTIWNLRASMLFGAGDVWPRAFRDELPIGHPDYPVLVPGLVARTWEWAGARDHAAPIGVAAGFLFGTCATLFGCVAALRGTTTAAGAVAVVLAVPSFVELSASQYADVPLACYALLAAASFVLADRSRDPGARSGLLLGAGFALGCLVWTKNEGALVAIAIVAWRALRWLSSGQHRESYAQLARLLLGAAPGVVALVWFKTALAQANDLVTEARAGGVLARVLDPDRHLAILRAFFVELIGLAPVVLAVVPLVVLPIGVILASAWRRRRGRRDGLLFAVLLVYVGYYVVFLTTSPKLRPHLATALDRLLLQGLPLVVLWAFSGTESRVPAAASRERETISSGSASRA
jgi:hypothetical protein